MTHASRHLAFLRTLLLLAMLVGAVVAIRSGWPAQFGGGGDPTDVAGEAAALRPGRIGTVGCVVLILVSIAFIIGGVGEAVAPPTTDVPRLVLIVSGVVATSLGALVIVAAAAQLRHRSQ